MKTLEHSEINWPRLIAAGKILVGKPYVFGAEVNLSDPDPSHIKAIDCSELIEYLYANLMKIDGTRAEINMPDGSYNQAKVVKRLDFGPPPKTDHLLLGDLAFKWNPETEVIHHVGIYLGGSDILEAKGKKWGTVITVFENYTNSSHFAYWGRHHQIEDA